MALWIATCADRHTRQAGAGFCTFIESKCDCPHWYAILHDHAGGFQTVALVGFIAPLSVTLLGPATGQLLDQSPRQLALNFCAVVQGLCIVMSGK